MTFFQQMIIDNSASRIEQSSIYICIQYKMLSYVILESLIDLLMSRDSHHKYLQEITEFINILCIYLFLPLPNWSNVCGSIALTIGAIAGPCSTACECQQWQQSHKDPPGHALFPGVAEQPSGEDSTRLV